MTTERLVIDINKDLKQQFKQKVEAQGQNMTFVLTKFIEEQVQGQKPKTKDQE